MVGGVPPVGANPNVSSSKPSSEKIVVLVVVLTTEIADAAQAGLRNATTITAAANGLSFLI
jgi:hypothetical protein